MEILCVRHAPSYWPCAYWLKYTLISLISKQETCADSSDLPCDYLLLHIVNGKLIATHTQADTLSIFHTLLPSHSPPLSLSVIGLFVVAISACHMRLIVASDNTDGG